MKKIKKFISFKIDEESISKLDLLASKKDVSRSEIIRDILSNSNDLKSDRIEENLIDLKESIDRSSEINKASDKRLFYILVRFSVSMFCQLINLHKHADNRSNDEYQTEVNFMFKDPETYANYLLSKITYEFDSGKTFEESEDYKKDYEKFFGSVI